MCVTTKNKCKNLTAFHIHNVSAMIRTQKSIEVHCDRGDRQKWASGFLDLERCHKYVTK